jgi:hypothetical protein
MPVLLLAQGDAPARDAVRKAIEARYGMRPPVLDSLQIHFKGQFYTNIGPMDAWVPIEATARFRFPAAMRWDFIIKPLNLPQRRGIEAFDGVHYRRVSDGKTVQIVEDEKQITSVRRRMWAIAAILLTPLSDMQVKLSTLEQGGIRASNIQLGAHVDIQLQQDNVLESVQVRCMNSETNTKQDFKIQLSQKLISMGALLLPDRIRMLWDHDPSMQLEPVSAKSNLDLPNNLFALSK